MGKYVGVWVGPVRGCLLLFQCACGKMRMARASRSMCAVIMARCSVYAMTLVDERGISPPTG